MNSLLSLLHNLQAAVIDWSVGGIDLDAQVLLLSDINYNPGEFAILHDMLFHFLDKGTSIILATPQRLMAKTFVAPLLPFASHQEELEVRYKNESEAITLLVLQ